MDNATGGGVVCANVLFIGNNIFGKIIKRSYT